MLSIYFSSVVEDRQLLSYVEGGGRVAKRPCPEAVVAVMERCWHSAPQLRPV